MPSLTLYDRRAPDDYRNAIAELIAKGFTEAEATVLAAKRFPQRVTIAKSHKDHSMSAWDVITKKAEALVAAGESPTFPQAVDTVCQAEPALYDAYQLEAQPHPEAAPVPPRTFEKSAAMHLLEGIAKRHLSDGTVKTFEAGVDLAAQERPDLFVQVMNAERMRTV